MLQIWKKGILSWAGSHRTKSTQECSSNPSYHS